MMRRKGLISDEPYSRSKNTGRHYIYKFDNGYGASVIPEIDLTSIIGSSSPIGTQQWVAVPGEYELAVLRYADASDLDYIVGLGPEGDDYWIDYANPLTDDVYRHLTEEEVNDILEAIERLPHASASSQHK